MYDPAGIYPCNTTRNSFNTNGIINGIILACNFICKTIGNFFLLSTDLVMEFDITDEQYADERFPSTI